MRRYASLACVLAFAACATAPQPAPATPVASTIDFSPMDQSFRDNVRRLNYQGAALIVNDDGVVWRAQNGSVDCTPGGRQIEATDLFDTGSVTKIFTVTLILQLIERGEITFDTPLGELLAEAPADKAGITVRQILMHRSGLREASGTDEVYISRDAMLAQEFATPLVFAPGAGEEYSNVGYSMLAAYLERHYRRAYEHILRREILNPLHLESIGYVQRPSVGADVCGWWDGRANPRFGSVRDYFTDREPSWNLIGNGALLSRPDDLARFYHALVTGRILNAEHTALLRDEMAREWYGRDVYITSGSNVVFTSFIAHYRDTRLTFIMMSNDSRAPKERAMFFFNQGLNAVMDAEAPRS
jgi:CubicO group peptidase (beta-lactamase class C family)